MPLLKEQFDFVENNYKKLLGLAQQGVQAVDKAIDENIPGGEQFTERWATGVQRIGSFVQGEMDAADRQVDEPIDHIGDIPYFLFGAYRRGAQQYTNNARNLATKVGLDPRAGNVLGMAAEGVAEVGLGGLGKAASSITPPGPGLKPALAGAGSAVPTPGATVPSNVSQITVTKPELLAPGVKQGVGKSDKFAPGVTKLRAQSTADVARKQMYMEQFAAGEITKDQLTERLAKVKKRGDAKYSTLPTKDDPDIFEVTSQQNLDPTNPSIVADQHHAAAKSMTTPWVKKALELGDDDDVVALFELHRMLTGSGMGNVKSGIIDAPTISHLPGKAKAAGRDPKQTIHSFMKKSGAGIEIRTADVEKIVGNPKNMDELLEKYTTFANEYLIPQKELSLKAVRKELADHRATLSGDALKDFDLLVKKLNMAGT